MKAGFTFSVLRDYIPQILTVSYATSTCWRGPTRIKVLQFEVPWVRCNAQFLLPLSCHHESALKGLLRNWKTKGRFQLHASCLHFPWTALPLRMNSKPISMAVASDRSTCTLPHICLNLVIMTGCAKNERVKPVDFNTRFSVYFGS